MAALCANGQETVLSFLGPRLGFKVAWTIQRVGIKTVNDLAERSPRDLMTISGVGQRRSAIILELLEVHHNNSNIIILDEYRQLPLWQWASDD